MSDGPVRFTDGAGYERFMGAWSRLVGEIFLDWIAPPPGLRWADVGCGNGAFTELLLRRAKAIHVDGIDPSPGQLAFARSRVAERDATFHLGSAVDLPFADMTFDVAAMALVIFFVPVPEDGVAEMVRVTKPGGTVAGYVWDVPGGGFPTDPVAEDLRAFGLSPPRPPRWDISSMDALRTLWTKAGLEEIRGRIIKVERTFASFDEWWEAARGAPSLGDALEKLAPAEAARLQDTLRDRLRPASDGTIRCRAQANAIAGVRPR